MGCGSECGGGGRIVGTWITGFVTVGVEGGGNPRRVEIGCSPCEIGRSEGGCGSWSMTAFSFSGSGGTFWVVVVGTK